MALVFGPRTICAGITEPSQVTVVHAITNQPAEFSVPISVDGEGNISFTVTTAGRYRVTAKTAFYQETVTVDLHDEVPYGADIQSKVDYILSNLGGGGGGGVTSVNGKTGVVNLTASDVNAKPASYVPAWDDITGKPDTLGAVDSVNGKTGEVEITSEDIPLAVGGVVIGVLNDSLQSLSNSLAELGPMVMGKADANHTHTSSNVTDFTEAVQDVMGSSLVAGTNISINYDDATGEISIASSGEVGGSVDWDDIDNKPTVIAAGDDAAAARSAIGAGTSNLALGTTSSTAKAGDWVPAIEDVDGLTEALEAKVESTDLEDFVTETDMSSALSTKADAEHTHSQSDIDGLSTALSGKANATHTHAQSDITGLSTALAGKADAADLDDYLPVAHPGANEGDILRLDSDRNAVPEPVTTATAGDIPYDGESSIADVLADIISRVEALETSGPPLTNLSKPEISGTFEVGEVVTTSNGTWSETPDSYEYQWLRSGTPIEDATSDEYTLTSADLGTNTVSVQVTAIKAGYTSGVAVSDPITVTADLEFVGIVNEYMSANTSSSVVLTRTENIQEGDFLVAILGSGHNAATSDFAAQGGSGTWTRLGPAWPGTGSPANRVCGFYGHIVGDLETEPETYTFAHTPGTATAKAGQLLVFRNVDPNAPVNVAVTDYLGTTITNGRQTESLSNTADNAILLFAGWKEGSSASSTTLSTEPSGMTHIEQTVGGEVGVSSITVIESYYQEVDSGATGTKSIAWSAATNPRAQAIVLQGVSS